VTRFCISSVKSGGAAGAATFACTHPSAVLGHFFRNASLIVTLILLLPKLEGRFVKLVSAAV
jgi:hypothetical protein